MPIFCTPWHQHASIICHRNIDIIIMKPYENPVVHRGTGLCFLRCKLETVSGTNRRPESKNELVTLQFGVAVICVFIKNAVGFYIKSLHWQYHNHMKKSSNENIFRVTGPLWGISTGDRWMPLTKARHAQLWWFFMCAWTNGWANSRHAGNLRRLSAHCDVVVMHTRTMMWLSRF